MRKVLLDAHTHTVASDHAYSSLQEMAKAAADMGVLGITEHGPSVPGTCPTLYFKNMFVVPRQMYGIRLLMGCEINILDTKGSLDLTDEQIDWLDIAIAGVHAAWYQAGTKEENTQGMVNVIKNPRIHIISHPGDGSCELDFEPLVLAAKEANNGIRRWQRTTIWRSCASARSTRFLPFSAAMPTSHSRLPTTSVFIRFLQKLTSQTN